MIDEVITEPQGGAHKDIVFKQNKLNNLLFISNELNKLDGQALANHRFNKFRNIGTFISSTE